jgi:hypothetical protein
MLLSTGCLKEEAPVTLEPKNPNSSYKQFDCSPESNLATFFDMSTGAVYYANNRDWHIALDARKEGHSIRTNLTEANYKLYNTRDLDFYANYSGAMTESNLVMDSVSSLNQNNAVCATGPNTSNVFIYHHEPDILGESEMKIQFQLLNVSKDAYYLQYKDLLDTAEVVHIIRVVKNQNFNFMYLCFTNGAKLVKIEPTKDKWDIVFTQYREMVKYTVDLKYYPYQVMGILINPHRTNIYELTKSKEFSEVNSDDCKLAVWTQKSNEVGFDWKEYSINNAIYTVDKSRTWLLNDQSQNFFKFRFINYYNNNGQSGYPTIEYGSF